MSDLFGGAVKTEASVAAELKARVNLHLAPVLAAMDEAVRQGLVLSFHIGRDVNLARHVVQVNVAKHF